MIASLFLSAMVSLTAVAAAGGEPAGKPAKVPSVSSPPRSDQPAATPRDKVLTNSLGMKLAWVPPGKFWMGGGGGKPGEREVEIPRGFYLGVTTATQGQWQALMGTNPSGFSRTGDHKDKVNDISDGDLAQFPVENVSWNDAQEFLAKLNEREKVSGWVYRLPKEAEWEYACRGGATSKEDCAYDYYLERPSNDLSSTEANFDGKHPGGNGVPGPCLGRTTKVGSYKPNRLGLFDMHGNVYQWCDDILAQGSSSRVVRGGCLSHVGQRCRSAYRGAREPRVRSYTLGFRLALVPSGAAGK